MCSNFAGPTRCESHRTPNKPTWLPGSGSSCGCRDSMFKDRVTHKDYPDIKTHSLCKYSSIIPAELSHSLFAVEWFIQVVQHVTWSWRAWWGFPWRNGRPSCYAAKKKSPPIISVEINRCELEGKIWLYDITEGRLAGFKSGTASKHRGWCKKWAPFVTLHKGNTRNRSSVTPSLIKNHNFCLDTACLA